MRGRASLTRARAAPPPASEVRSLLWPPTPCAASSRRPAARARTSCRRATLAGAPTHPRGGDICVLHTPCPPRWLGRRPGPPGRGSSRRLPPPLPPQPGSRRACAARAAAGAGRARRARASRGRLRGALAAWLAPKPQSVGTRRLEALIPATHRPAVCEPFATPCAGRRAPRREPPIVGRALRARTLAARPAQARRAPPARRAVRARAARPAGTARLQFVAQAARRGSVHAARRRPRASLPPACSQPVGFGARIVLHCLPILKPAQAGLRACRLSVEREGV
ncbi:MAG: hypothetical protein J3K34DRAFT_442538 [Monoraphidium minutum]|nr:MAG: hypothetical protein J3K34DRAFT_442538 [Monoraphidium minutum]